VGERAAGVVRPVVVALLVGVLGGAAAGWVGGGGADTRGGGGARGRPAGGVGCVVLRVGVGGWGGAAGGGVGGGGADTRAGEGATVRAAGGSEGELVTQDPRVGPIEPLQALGGGSWLRATEAGSSLEGAVRQARVPSRFLLGGVVGLT